MTQVCLSVALSVAYLPFERLESYDTLLRALSTTIVSIRESSHENVTPFISII